MFSVFSQPARRYRHTVTAERPLCSINLSKASGGSESIEGMFAWLFMPFLGVSTYRKLKRSPVPPKSGPKQTLEAEYIPVGTQIDRNSYRFALHQGLEPSLLAAWPTLCCGVVATFSAPIVVAFLANCSVLEASDINVLSLSFKTRSSGFE